MINKILFFTLFSTLICNTIFAQELKKEITQAELDSLKDEIESPVQVGFNINITENYLTGDYPKNQKDIDEKRKKKEKELSENPEDIDLLISVANFYEQEEKIEYLQKAIGILEEDTNLREINGNDYLKAAEIFFAAGRFEQSYENYQKASEMIPDSSKVWSILASFSYGSSDIQEAREFSKKALKLDIENIDAQILYCHSFLMESLIQVSNIGDDFIYEEDNQMQIDYSYLDKAISQFPEKKKYEVIKSSFELMTIFYSTMLGLSNKEQPDDLNAIFSPNETQKLKLKELEKYFKNAIKKEHVDKVFLNEMLGTVYMMQKQPKKALNYLEQVIAVDKLTSARFYNVAFIYGIQEDWTGIAPTLESKAEVEEFDYVLVGFAEYMQDNLDEAIEKYDEGLSEFPQSALLLHLKARAEYDSGNLENAEENLKKAQKIDPQEENIPFLLALIALEQEKWAGAYEYLQKAEGLGHESAKEVKETYYSKNN